MVFKSLNIRQKRTEILQKTEDKWGEPYNHCLESYQALAQYERASAKAIKLLLWRSRESEEAKVARVHTTGYQRGEGRTGEPWRSPKGQPQEFSRGLISTRMWGNYPRPWKGPRERIRESSACLQGVKRSSCSCQPD